MNSLNQFFTTAAVLATLSFNISHSQILGGRENSQSTPKVAEASKLSGGSFTGDVNTMTGEYQASLPLGTVSTPGGLSYTLNLNHNSTFSYGTNEPMTSGLSYGEGWNLSLPTISVETDVFHRFRNYQECDDNDQTNFSTNDLTSDYLNTWEGDLFWFSPTVNIPGAGGGRAVFKYIDASSGDAIFALNTFESPMEIRLTSDFKWIVTLADGTTYHFGTTLKQFRAPSNKRLLPYNPNILTPDDGPAGDALVEDDYTISPETISNTIEPKEDISIWYGDLITNPNILGQAIHFEYEKYGAFNFFAEFQQQSYNLVHKEVFGDLSMGYLPNYTAYRDILLKSVTSYVVDETPLDILELEYSKLQEAYGLGSQLLNPDDVSVTVIDPMYCSEVVYRWAADDSEFDEWKRYKHVNYLASGINEDYTSEHNPYVNASNNRYLRENVTTTEDAAFDHGFLESPRLTIPQSSGAGDLFEIRTRISRPDGEDLKNGNGTVDIALVTSDGSHSTYNDTVGTHIPTSYYNKTRGEQIFSTFNMAMKWQMGWEQEVLQTSNFFVMPNVPENFGGFNIQVGPGNSDINYGYMGSDLYYSFSLNGTGSMPNALNAYPQLYGAGGMKSAATVPRNFGTGHPWGIMAPIYNHMARNAGDGVTYSAADHELLYQGSWSVPASVSPKTHHKPTKFDAEVKLEEVELVRYSKIAYMLQGVKQYKVNGEYEPSINETGKKLIAQKKLDYEVQSVNRIRNLDYQPNQALVMEPNLKRQIILLSRIHEVPVEGDLYATNFGLSDPTVVLSTKLEYANILPTITGTVYFDELKSYQGLVHFALVKFIDHLGGETSIEYYPVDAPETRWTPNTNYNNSCSGYTISAYGSNRTFTLHPAVKYISKFVENYNIATGQYVNPVRRWEYVYDLNSSIYNRRELHIPSKHFRGHYFHTTDRAFGKVTVYSPALSDGTRNYTVYEYIGKQAYPYIYDGFTTIENFLFYGKPKSVKQYDHNGVLHSSTDYEYDYTLAFENGYKRPNFMREGIGLYDHPVLRDYEYKDYYLDEVMEVANPSGPGMLTGHEAKVTLASDVLKEGTTFNEKPKFLLLYFFNELTTNFEVTDVNGQAVSGTVTNPDYFLNSYFIKKTAEINRTYEDGLSVLGTSVSPAYPNFEVITLDPEGTGVVNPVNPDPEVDNTMITDVENKGDDAFGGLLDASPLSDPVLTAVVNSSMDPKNIVDVLLLQTGGFSEDVWEHIIDQHGNFTTDQLNQLVYHQPYFTDETQSYLIGKAGSGYDDKFYQTLLLRNPKLSDDRIEELCYATNIPGESFDIVLAGQTHQFSGGLLTEIIRSSNFTSANYHDILSDQWLSEGHYNDLISYSFLDDEGIVQLIEANHVKPTDATVEDFISIRRPSFAHAQRVVDVLDRELSSSLYTLLTATYQRPEIVFPINVNPLNQYCGNAVATARTYIETKTEYEYYEADYRGVAKGKAFELLLGKIESVDEPSAYPMTISAPLMGSSMTVPHLQLKHEPSWQVFSVKTTSPHLPGAFNREEYFYYYDLQNRYDRIWYNFDQSGDGAITSVELYTDPNTQEVLDTIARNTNYTSYYTGYPPLVPAFDGMAGARENNMRTTAFQKTTFSKNTRDAKALRRSDYYDYDRRWEIDDLTPTDVYTTEMIDTDPCPTPPSYPCDDCIYANHVFTQDQIDLFLDEGYCVWEATPGSGYAYDYYACPESVTDMTPCDPTAVLVACPVEQPGGSIPGNGYIVVGKALSKSLQLREVSIQVDSIDVNGYNTFDDYKVDGGNAYIAEFEMGNPDDYDANNFAGGEYNMVLPFTSLTVRTVDDRNRHLQPELEHNQMGLKTRYYYDKLIRKRYISDDCAADNYSTKINTNIGLPVRITVGYERSDSLSTTYEYTDAEQVKKVTEPSGKYLECDFDGYQRLVKITENGTRILSDYTYHQWDNNETFDFYDRTAENYVQTTTYNSAMAGDHQWQRAYMDPLGRTQSAITSYYEGSTIHHIHSSSAVYDNWDRVVRAHKNYTSSAAFNPTSDTYNPSLGLNYGMAYSDAYHENTPKNRAKKTANFGVSITDPANHTVRTNYAIANNIYTSCELGLSLGELPQIMGPGTTGAFRFYRTEVFDQDNKQSVEYANALGQKVATLKYNDNYEKIVTLFMYDSYGNLTKVINPKKQRADYRYNILGQLYEEETVDAGKKKYMYNKQGLVSVTLDEQGWNNENNIPEADPFYRVYEYDIYGRVLGVGKSKGPLNYTSRTTYGPLHYETTYIGEEPGQPDNYDYTIDGVYFDYLFTNGSTQDWLCRYDVWGWEEPEVGFPTYEPLLVSIKDLFNRFPISEKEKGYVYATNTELTATGKIKETHSYNNADAMIQKTVYTYDILGNIATQTVYFNPDQVTGGAPVFPAAPSVITYPAYNYRRSLLEEKVDVDGNSVVDLHYFYEYDKLNRLKGIYAAKEEVNGKSNATLLVSYEHDDANGVILKKTHSIDNNSTSVEVLETNYSYDVRDRLTAINAINKVSGNQVSLMHYQLYYDNQQPYHSFGQAEPLQYSENWNGNINGTLMGYDFGDAQEDPSNFQLPLLYGYTYDKINRLTMADAMVGDFIAEAEENQTNESFQVGDVDISYDKIGNILSLLRHLRSQDPQEMLELEHYNYQYTTGTNRLAAVQGLSGTSGRLYTYDENGNLLTDTHRDIDKTEYGRAAYAYFIDQDAAQISYLYSTDDQRMYKEVATASELKQEYYLSDASGKVIALRSTVAETGQSPETTWEYYVHGAERDARLVKVHSGAKFGTDEVSFFLYDHLGNTRMSYTPKLRPGTTTVVQVSVNAVMDYYPYGKILKEYNGDEERYLTTQHERDVETGLDYRGARYYDADVARFLSLDPHATRYPSLSAFCYVGGNPIAYIDPDGKDSIKVYSQWRDKYRKFHKKESHDDYDPNLREDVYLYNTYNSSGKIKYVEYVGQKTGRRYVAPSGEVDYFALYQTFSGEDVASRDVRASDKYYDPTEGGAEAANNDSEWTGIKGARKFTTGVNYVGIGLQFTVVGAPVGRGLCLFADIYDTAIDYEEHGSTTALINGFIRLGTNMAGSKLDKMVDSASGLSEGAKQFSKATQNGAVEEVESTCTE